MTYHANGGTFKDGSDTNVVTYGPPVAEKITKTSKTNNVSDDGSSYSGGYGDNKAITDKVTIPGAKELKVPGRSQRIQTGTQKRRKLSQPGKKPQKLGKK